MSTAAIRQAIAALFFSLLAINVAAQPSARVDLYLFWAIGCPHCEREIEFLKRLEAEEPRLQAHYLEISRDAVTLVELLCSAGIPAVYTQVLALSHLPVWQYYAYLWLYILVFMLDDLFVFVVAMKTLQITGVTTRYTRFSHLAGGAVLLAVGALLLLRPEWLMFG